MPRPAKPKTKPQNGPINFDETIAVVGQPHGDVPADIEVRTPATETPAPAQPTTEVAENLVRPKSGPFSLRRVMILIWALAAIFAGIGLGSVIKNWGAVLVTEAPVPVATASVVVKDIPGQSVRIVTGTVTSPALGGVVSPTALNQAAAGSTFATVSAAYLQTTDGSNGLLPGFTHFGRAQGNLGVAPVR